MPMNDELRRAAELASYYGLLTEYFAYRDPQTHAYYGAKHREYIERTAALALRLDPPPRGASGDPRRGVAAAEASGGPIAAAPYGWGMAPHAPEPAASAGPASAQPPVPRDAARIRAVHAMPDAGAVDVYANGRRLLGGISYKADADYFAVPAGAYRVELFPAGETAAPLAARELLAAPGASYTLAAAGTGEAPALLAYTDQPIAPPNASRIRFLHLAPDAPAADVAFAGRGMRFRSVGYGQATPYADAAPGAYDAKWLAAGTNDVLLDIPNLKLSRGVAHTVAIVGRFAGPPGLEAKLLRG